MKGLINLIFFRNTLLFTALGIMFFTQTAKSQSTRYLKDSDSIKFDKKELRIQHKYEERLKKAKQKQQKYLLAIKATDSISLGYFQISKLVSNNKKIEKIEKKLTVPKINKNKLLSDVIKDAKADPYLKEYAKFKQSRKPVNIEDAVIIANSNVIKNKEIATALNERTKLKGIKLDSASLISKGTQLSLAELNKQKKIRELKKELVPYLNSPYLKGYTLNDLDSLSADSLKIIAQNTFENLDKILEKELSKRAEVIVFKADMIKMKEFKNLPENYKKQFDQYTNTESLQKEGVSRSVKEATKYLAKHQDNISRAQSKLAKLKKKYSSVPNSNDLSSATKRNSLKVKPFKERVVIGANVQLISSDPFILDISPILGYKIDKGFQLGIGATYRARFSQKKGNQNFLLRNSGIDELTYGYRAFGDYIFWKEFYIHGEYERMSKEFEMKTAANVATDQFERRWIEAALLGIGKSYSINGKVEGGISLLYNFMYNTKDKVYTSPWIFRIGFTLK